VVKKKKMFEKDHQKDWESRVIGSLSQTNWLHTNNKLTNKQDKNKMMNLFHALNNFHLSR